MAPVYGDKETLINWAKKFSGVESSDILHYYSMPRFQGFGAWLSEDAVEEIRLESIIKSLDEDTIVSLDFTTEPYGEKDGLLGVAQRVPKNPAWDARLDYGQLRINSRNWNLQTIPDALYSPTAPARYANPYATNWNWTDQSRYATPSKGRGAIVWVVDTGVRPTHVEFIGTDGISRVTQNYNFVSTDNQTNDGNGHGTHCAGTIGGNWRGVAPEVEIRSIRVLNNGGSGSWADVIAGINFVAQNDPKSVPNILSASLGGAGYQPVDDAINAASEAGVSCVIAAGNSNNNACGNGGVGGNSPARARLAIAVSAIDSSDTIASFSSYGPCIKSSAPGVTVTSAWIPPTGQQDNDWYNDISGTSMATPHVAGAIAAYVGQGGVVFDPESVKAALGVDQTVGVLKGLDGVKATTPNLYLYSRWKLPPN